jgi:hypothetical protein
MKSCLTIVHFHPEKQDIAKERMLGQSVENVFNVFEILKDDSHFPFILHFNQVYYRTSLNPYSSVRDVIQWLGLEVDVSLMTHLDSNNAFLYNNEFLDFKVTFLEDDDLKFNPNLSNEDPLHKAVWVSHLLNGEMDMSKLESRVDAYHI